MVSPITIDWTISLLARPEKKDQDQDQNQETLELKNNSYFQINEYSSNIFHLNGKLIIDSKSTI